MGLLSRLFSGEESGFPELHPHSETAARIERHRELLRQLAAGTRGDRLELILAGEGGFIFVGRPPKTFGLTWLEDGRVCNFKTLIVDRGLDAERVDALVADLRHAYERNNDTAERYRYRLDGRSIVVRLDSELEREISRLIDEVSQESR